MGRRWLTRKGNYIKKKGISVAAEDVRGSGERLTIKFKTRQQGGRETADDVWGSNE